MEHKVEKSTIKITDKLITINSKKITLGCK